MIRSLRTTFSPLECHEKQINSPPSFMLHCCSCPKAEPALHAVHHKKAPHGACATTRTSLVAPTPRTDNCYFRETACAYVGVCDSSSIITSRRSCGVQLSNSPSTDKIRPMVTPPALHEARSRVRGAGYLHILPNPDDAILGRRVVTPGFG